MVIQFILKAYTRQNISRATLLLSSIFEKSSSFRYPTQVKKLTVLSSPHIDKKSREQFETRTYKTQISFHCADQKQIDKIIPLDIKNYNSLEKKILDLKKNKIFFDKKINNNSQFYKNFFLQLENQYFNLFKE